MQKAVIATFRTLVDFLLSELAKVPLSGWTESVLRFFYCKFLTASFPDIEQFVECGKIDLVLKQGTASAFVEFKFYRHPVRHDPYDGFKRGFKGGPGPKNLAEFQSCVDQLSGRRSIPRLKKYIVLIYADPADGSRPKSRFSKHYDKYRHPNGAVQLVRLKSRPLTGIDNVIVRAQLYEVRHR